MLTPSLDGEDIRAAAANELGIDPVGRSSITVRALLADDGIFAHADPYVLDQVVMWLARTRYEKGFPSDLGQWLDAKFQDCADATDSWQAKERTLAEIEAHL